MPKRTRPRRGSLQFWPRKRAKRIYTRISHWHSSKDILPLGFAGWKAGMTHISYIENNPKSPRAGRLISKAVTILDAPPLFVLSVRFYKKTENGIKCISEKWAEKIPKSVELKRKGIVNPKGKESEDFDDVRIVVATQPSKSGMRKMKPEVFEMAVGGNKEEKAKYALSMLGKEISASDIFKPGEIIDVSSVTKAHGFTGPVKRFGIRIQGRKDKQMHRHTGSIGGWVPRKVDWRVPLPGQFGFFSRTEAGKRLVEVGDDSKKVIPSGGFLGYGIIPNNYIIIEGSVPGTRKRLVRLRKTEIHPKPVEMSFISLQSKQGR